VRTFADQLDSGGASQTEIVHGTLAAAHPERGLRWLDIGCGRGDLLRVIKQDWAPAELHGLDPLDWLDEDLRGAVDFHQLPAEQADDLPLVDRVLMIEVIEHLEAPWLTLRKAAGRVAPGGWLVVSTPNLATLRTRLELAVRGNLTSFRPDYQPHISPALPHVTRRLLEQEGLVVQDPEYLGVDVISLSKGRVWPEPLRRRWPQLTSVSVVLAAQRPAIPT
jgi:2-polyprenyl-3-methyl-5-hydroxy-6-metoxy-1,4-benzoquinol methylase